MKQQIDNLIANTLLDEGEVYLPGKGSLILRRHAASRLSSKKMQSPYRELVFTSEERGINLIALISKAANVSEERASDIFTEWLSKSSRVQSPTRRSLIISGVCTIATFEVESRSTNNSYRGEKSEVKTDQKFEDMANPKGRKVKKVSPRPKYFIYILTSTIVGIALGVSSTYFYVNGTFDELLKQQSAIPTSDVLKGATAVVTPTVEPTEEVKESVVTTTTEEPVKVENEAIAEQPQVVEQPTEPAVEQTTEQTTEPVVERPTEPVVEQTAEPVVEKPAEPVVEEENKFEIKQMKKGQSYAVWGIYRDVKNSKKAIARLAVEHPTFECKLYRYGAQHLLTIYEVPSRTECDNQVKEWQKTHKGFHKVWVYTHK